MKVENLPALERHPDSKVRHAIVLRLALVGERFDARQLLAFQKFQRGSAASGDMSDLVGYAGSANCRDGVASADD